MNRRHYLGAIVASVGLLVAAILAALKLDYVETVPVIGTDPAHTIEIQNDRAAAQEVAVEYELDDETMNHGPWRISPGEIWGVTTIEQSGTLTIRVSVDGQQVWAEVQKVPMPDEKHSAITVTLDSDGGVSSVRRGEK